MNLSRKGKAILAYIFPIVSGLVFLAIEQEDEFIRKCAAQSFVFGLSVEVLNVCLAIIPFFGNMLSFIFRALSFALWIVLIIKAYNNIYYRLPVISEISEKYFLNLFK